MAEPSNAASVRPAASNVRPPHSSVVSKRSATRSARGCRAIPTEGSKPRGTTVYGRRPPPYDGGGDCAAATPGTDAGSAPRRKTRARRLRRVLIGLRKRSWARRGERLDADRLPECGEGR